LKVERLVPKPLTLEQINPSALGTTRSPAGFDRPPLDQAQSVAHGPEGFTMKA
jgi:hypothetical protein